jgi:hypothetical protein
MVTAAYKRITLRISTAAAENRPTLELADALATFRKTSVWWATADLYSGFLSSICSLFELPEKNRQQLIFLIG